jgi:Probable cobalt transporter subunit (CbtA)
MTRVKWPASRATEAMGALRGALRSAIIAGLIAAVLASLFHQVVTGPVIDRAIATEEAREAAKPGHAHEELVVSRRGQKIGLVVGLLIYGLTWGLLVGISLYLLKGELATHPARGRRSGWPTRSRAASPRDWRSSIRPWRRGSRPTTRTATPSCSRCVARDASSLVTATTHCGTPPRPSSSRASGVSGAGRRGPSACAARPTPAATLSTSSWQTQFPPSAGAC